MSKKNTDGHTASLVIRKVQIESTLRQYYAFNRVGLGETIYQVLARVWRNSHAQL